MIPIPSALSSCLISATICIDLLLLPFITQSNYKTAPYAMSSKGISNFFLGETLLHCQGIKGIWDGGHTSSFLLSYDVKL